VGNRNRQYLRLGAGRQADQQVDDLDDPILPKSPTVDINDPLTGSEMVIQ